MTRPPYGGPSRERAHPATFSRPVFFWLGALACTAGVALHLPMYISARGMGYRMVGMRTDPEMVVGMVLIVAGLIASLYGLLPAGAAKIGQRAARLRVSALDDARIGPRHIALLAVMAIAITIDVMKPTTLAFVAPGMAKEYGLKSAVNPHGHLPVALLPLVGITGTVIGSFVWGWMADRIGRRSSIIFASLLFVTTGICGAMPSFDWNLLMCFMMGIAAGGMLPIAFSLMAETIPARHRGWLLVLIGGDVAGAYVITSWLAGWLIPTFSWRIMWLIGIPTGLLLVVLSRWIPESPRYLLAAGQPQAAKAIMAQYGATVAEEEQPPAGRAGGQGREGFVSLLRSPFTRNTLAIAILGIGAGLVTYGFQLWIPTNLQHLGFTSVATDYTVRNAAVIGLPLTVLVAWLYGFWSSKKTIIVLAGLTALTLLGFVVAGNSLAHHRLALSLLLVVPLSAVSSLVAAVVAYSAEVYPTLIRSRAAGFAAGMTKAGGVAIIAVVVAATTIPSIAATALIGAVPLLLATAAFVWAGRETRQRRLDEISPANLALAESS